MYTDIAIKSKNVCSKDSEKMTGRIDTLDIGFSPIREQRIPVLTSLDDRIAELEAELARKNAIIAQQAEDLSRAQDAVAELNELIQSARRTQHLSSIISESTNFNEIFAPLAGHLEID